MRKARADIARGALVLTVSGLIVKALGLLYKIPLTNLMGDSGMGFFGSAYTVYTVFYTLSTAGVTTAMSLLVSEAEARGEGLAVRRIYKTAFLLFVAVGLVASLAMVFFSNALASLIGNKESDLAIALVSPTVLFVCAASVIRGYFQGVGNMLPSALSQTAEAAGKLLFGLLFARAAKNAGYSAPFVAAFALLGLSIASGIALLMLLFMKLLEKKRSYPIQSISADNARGATAEAVKRLFSLAVPITLSSLALTLASSLDLFMVMKRLTGIGYSAEEANVLFGNYTSLALPMFNMPTVFILPITALCAPSIKRAAIAGDREALDKNVSGVMLAAVLVSMPIALGMCALPAEILSLIFKNQQSVEMAAPLLRLLSPSVVLLAILSVTSAALQALGRERMPLISILAGAAVKAVSAYFLVGKYAVAGAPMSTFLCYATALTLNILFLSDSTRCNLRIMKTSVRPFVYSLIACSAAYAVQGYAASGRGGVILAILAACVVYMMLLAAEYFKDIKKLLKGNENK